MTQTLAGPTNRRTAAPARLPRRVRAAALVLLFLSFLTLASWAWSSPTGSSPDEDYHLAKMYCAAGRVDCDPDGPRTFPCFAFNPRITGDCQPQELVWSPYGQTHKQPMETLTEPPAQAIFGDRPDLYYRFASLFIGDTLGETTMRLRMLNCLLGVALAGLSVLLSRPNLRPAVAVSWLVASVPLGLFLMSSISPNGWSIMGVAALWGPLLTLVTSPDLAAPRSWRRGTRARLLFAQIVVLMALGSRTEAAMILPIVAASLAVFILRRPRAMKRHSWVGLAVLGAVVAQAAVAVLLTPQTRDTVTNLALGTSEHIAAHAVGVGPDTTADGAGTAVPFAAAARAAAAPAAPAAAAANDGSLASAYDLIVDGYRAVFDAVVNPVLGWLDTPLPQPAVLLGTAVFFSCFIVGAAVVYSRKYLAFGLLVGFTLVLGTFMVWRASISGFGPQPRYFLGLLFVMLGFSLLPRLRGRARIPTRLQAAVILGGIAVVNGATLLTQLRRYVVGFEAPAPAVSDLPSLPIPSWWWLGETAGPAALWWLGTLSLAGVAALLVWILPTIAGIPAESEKRAI